MELSSVLRKVRQLVAVAEHEATPAAEAKLSRERADALMLKYAIDQARLDESRPEAERSKPGTIEVSIGEYSEVISYVGRVASDVAAHCRCLIRLYTRHDSANGGWMARVYGYESDLRYFELLYTTLRLHMLGVLLPGIDTGKSLEDNAYALHNAGFNWLEIAGMYGWVKVDDRSWYHSATDTTEPATQVGSRIKRAYYRACTARDEQPTKIAAGGSKTFRRSAAQGYASRIWRRLEEVAGRREVGSALVLRADDLDAFFRAANPDLFAEHEDDEQPAKKSRRRAFKPAPFNADAYGRGVAHANTADLSANARAEAGSAKAIG